MLNPLEQMMSGLHHELKLLRAENEQLKQHLKSTTNKGADETKMNQNGQQQGNVKGEDSDFYDMLQEFMVENENLKQENGELNRDRDKLFQDCERVSGENEHLKKQIEEIKKMMRTIEANRNNQTAAGNQNDEKTKVAKVKKEHHNARRNSIGNHKSKDQQQRTISRNRWVKPQDGKAYASNIDLAETSVDNDQMVGKVSSYPYSTVPPLAPISPVKKSKSTTQVVDIQQQQHLQQQQEFMLIQQQQQSYVQKTMVSQPNYRFIEPQIEPTIYTGRETTRKMAFRHSPILKG